MANLSLAQTTRKGYTLFQMRIRVTHPLSGEVRDVVTVPMWSKTAKQARADQQNSEVLEIWKITTEADIRPY